MKLVPTSIWFAAFSFAPCGWPSYSTVLSAAVILTFSSPAPRLVIVSVPGMRVTVLYCPFVSSPAAFTMVSSSMVLLFGALSLTLVTVLVIFAFTMSPVCRVTVLPASTLYVWPSYSTVYPPSEWGWPSYSQVWLFAVTVMAFSFLVTVSLPGW